MTGVEIAGLALATFPIAVDGLRRMVEGVETIKYWRRYRVKLEEYACDLEAGRVYYLDTLEELLMGIVDSDNELAVLIGEPGGIAWRRPEYERSLRRRLDRSYDTYLQILDRLRNALTGIRGKLGFDEFGKVSDICSSCYQAAVQSRYRTMDFSAPAIGPSDDMSSLDQPLNQSRQRCS